MSFSSAGRWAVVTGASAGIGAEFARQLAAAGCHLVLVARRGDRLQALGTELSDRYGIDHRVEALDLSTAGAAGILAQRLAAIDISILINNAGFAITGAFEDAEWSAVAKMIDLNVKFTTEFTYHMLPRLKGRRDGARLLFVGSIAGCQGVPNMVAYSATKAYINNLAEGLNWECRGTAVKVACLWPGKTESEFFEVAGMRHSRFVRSNVMSARAVARVGLGAMSAGRPRIVAGLLNKFSVFSLRLSPRWLVRMGITWMFSDLRR